MGVWAILVGCIVGEVIAMSLLTKSEGFTQPLYGYPLACDLRWRYLGAVLRPHAITNGRRICGLVWDGHCADLHHWLGSSSATAHVGAGSVYCSDHRRRNRPEPGGSSVEPSTLISLWPQPTKRRTRRRASSVGLCKGTDLGASRVLHTFLGEAGLRRTG